MTRAGRVLAVAVVVAGSLLMAELLVRVMLEPPGRFPTRPEFAIITQDAVRGYALLPRATLRYSVDGHDTWIRLNARGFRDGPLEEARQAGLRMLAVGDSFTFGLGVDSADPWPRQVESMLRADRGPGVRVFNAGVPGYSARQMRQVEEELLPELRPDVVVFGLNPETYWRVNGPYVYVAGALVRTSALGDVTVGSRGLYYSSYARPWLRRIDLWLTAHLEVGAHLLALVDRSYTMLLAWRPGRPDAVLRPRLDLGDVRRSMAPVLDEILRAREVARSGGSDFVVLLINPQSPDGSFDETQFAYNAVVADLCRDQGITLIDPLAALVRRAEGEPVLRTSHDDYHWNAVADGVAASELYERLRHGVLAPASR